MTDPSADATTERSPQSHWGRFPEIAVAHLLDEPNTKARDLPPDQFASLDWLLEDLLVHPVFDGFTEIFDALLDLADESPRYRERLEDLCDRSFGATEILRDIIRSAFVEGVRYAHR